MAGHFRAIRSFTPLAVVAVLAQAKETATSSLAPVRAQIGMLLRKGTAEVLHTDPGGKDPENDEYGDEVIHV